MSSLVRNERTKLAAGALDRASTACLAVGVFAPTTAFLLGQAMPPPLYLAAIFAGWLFVAVMLHLVAQWLLGGLRP